MKENPNGKNWGDWEIRSGESGEFCGWSGENDVYCPMCWALLLVW